MSATLAYTRPKTVKDLVQELGEIPPDRIRLEPTPGTATLADLETPAGARCELIDGTLVENTMGLLESYFAQWFSHRLFGFLEKKDLGIMTVEQGMFELFPKLVRGPDVAFTSWSRIPNKGILKDSFPAITPEFVLEVLSPNNSRAEMARKREEYFGSGVLVVWEAEPKHRIVTVFTATDLSGQEHRETDTLAPGDFLPGFTVPLKDWFAYLDRLN